jgi:predicted ester cyclase
VKPILWALPDLTATAEEVIAEEHYRAAVRVTLTGTHRGPLLGIPPTERRVSLVLHEFHQLVDGRIAVTRHMEDWLGLFVQIGAFPENRDKN